MYDLISNPKFLVVIEATKKMSIPSPMIEVPFLSDYTILIIRIL